MRIMVLVAALTFAMDQLTKYAVVHWMNLRELYAIDVFPPFLNFRMAWNYGVNFGLFSEGSDVTRWVLISVAVVISAAVFWWIAREKPGIAGSISAGLLIGGALGNVIDRVLYGAVADFINMSCCGVHNPFSFNVADIAVFAGAFGLVLWTPTAGNENPT